MNHNPFRVRIFRLFQKNGREWTLDTAEQAYQLAEPEDRIEEWVKVSQHIVLEGETR